MTSRRTFLLKVIPAAGALAVLGGKAMAAPAAVVETDPQAIALGYKVNTAKVDKAKFPKHTADQHCGNCQLYQGAATAATAPCAIFGGKLVANKGWCSAWVKKA